MSYCNTVYRVSFVGNSKSGKSLIWNHVLNIDTTFMLEMGIPLYPTKGVEKSHFYLPHPSIESYDRKLFLLSDCAGNPENAATDKEYFSNMDIILIFHGGEIYRTPTEWEQIARKYAPNAKIHHITGNFDEKEAKVKSLLV